MLSPFPGGNVEGAFKGSDKNRFAGKSAAFGNFRNGGVGQFQQFLCVLQLKIEDILCGRNVVEFGVQMRETGFA